MRRSSSFEVVLKDIADFTLGHIASNASTLRQRRVKRLAKKKAGAGTFRLCVVNVTEFVLQRTGKIALHR